MPVLLIILDVSGRTLPVKPEINTVNDSFFKMILSRHSLGAKHLAIPAPDVGALRLAVTAACRVPCHQEALPLRWVEISSRERLADLFESVLPPEADKQMRDKARSKALKAPMCMALVGTGLTPDARDRDADERLMTAGASLMNFLAALHAQGFAAKTVSAKDFPAPDGLYDPTSERLLCFVLVGTPDAPLNYQDIGMGNDERQPLSRW